MVYRDLALQVRRKLAKASSKWWKRISVALNSFGSCLSLSTEDLADPVLLANCYRLKLWVITHGLNQADQALAYLKWLAKSSQSIFLNSRGVVESGESFFPGFNARDRVVTWTPFMGSRLDFIHKAFVSKSWNSRRLEEGRSLAQFGGLARALPYP